MLDFSELRTPADHGQVLVVPEPAAWVQVARANRKSLRGGDIPLLGSTLAAWRRKTRKAIVGHDDTLVIVIGHQPAFIHPGVWAKRIAAMRIARAVDGVALDLVVDSDAPKHTVLRIPSVRDQRVALSSVSFARLPAGCAYEQIERQTPDEVIHFERAVRDTMGGRYDDSQMPVFFEALSRATDARDWVDQAVAARRAVEANFGVAVDDRRVSSVWCSPLLADILLHAERFAASYNNALMCYRRVHRVRGAQRPIPDLHCGEQRCEVPVWVYRADQPRRRLFIAAATGGSSASDTSRQAARGTRESLRLFADHEEIGVVAVRSLESGDDLGAVVTDPTGWRLRPRALTLTIWARLLLADLFIHGIGGAKYDRISDAIIADYYGLTPPHMACVSATLHLGLPHSVTTDESVRRLRHSLRDLEWNPQRNLPLDPDLDPLIARRAEAVRRAVDLRENDPCNRRNRYAAFAEVRELNAAMLAGRQETLVARRNELARAIQSLQHSRIALGREYFFGLYDRARLEQLVEALPAGRDFRV